MRPMYVDAGDTFSPSRPARWTATFDASPGVEAFYPYHLSCEFFDGGTFDRVGVVTVPADSTSAEVAALVAAELATTSIIAVTRDDAVLTVEGPNGEEGFELVLDQPFDADNVEVGTVPVVELAQTAVARTSKGKLVRKVRAFQVRRFRKLGAVADTQIVRGVDLTTGEIREWTDAEIEFVHSGWVP